MLLTILLHYILLSGNNLSVLLIKKSKLYIVEIRRLYFNTLLRKKSNTIQVFLALKTIVISQIFYF